MSILFLVALASRVVRGLADSDQGDEHQLDVRHDGKVLAKEIGGEEVIDSPVRVLVVIVVVSHVDDQLQEVQQLNSSCLFLQPLCDYLSGL